MEGPLTPSGEDSTLRFQVSEGAKQSTKKHARATITDARVWFEVDIRHGEYKWLEPTGFGKKELEVDESGLILLDGKPVDVSKFVDGSLELYEKSETFERK